MQNLHGSFDSGFVFCLLMIANIPPPIGAKQNSFMSGASKFSRVLKAAGRAHTMARIANDRALADRVLNAKMSAVRHAIQANNTPPKAIKMSAMNQVGTP